MFKKLRIFKQIAQLSDLCEFRAESQYNLQKDVQQLTEKVDLLAEQTGKEFIIVKRDRFHEEVELVPKRKEPKCKC